MIYEKLYPFPKVETARLRMRKVCINDTPNIHEAFSDEKVTYPMLLLPKNDYTFAQVYVEETEAGYKSDTCPIWAVCNKDTDEFMGAFSLYNIDEKNNSAEIGYWLLSKYHNCGYATECVSAMIKMSFDFFGIHRIVARCRLDNKASIRVLKKSGMTIEGISKSMMMFDDKYHDIVWFASINNP